MLNSNKKRISLRFIDLFAGIGGFHMAFHRQGAECVFASEKDPFARQTYYANFKKISPILFEEDLIESPRFNSDITNLTNIKKQIEDHDILCAGFPCQPFSQAGHKKGFNEDREDRGNMFFWIRNILEAKKPRAFFLENVRHLENHDDGRTFDTIKQILRNDLNYTIYYKIIKASDYGLPQHRPRIFIIGFSNDYTYPEEFEFPEKRKLKFTMSDVWGGDCSREIGFTLRVGGKGSGIDDRRNWDAYLVDGAVRRLGIDEGKKMMGFPKSFTFPVAKGQAMKQLGNSVAVDAIEAVAKQMVAYLATGKKNKAKK
jgi:DNA (cytosine-5)-methyltransferase 1